MIQRNNICVLMVLKGKDYTKLVSTTVFAVLRRGTNRRSDCTGLWRLPSRRSFISSIKPIFPVLLLCMEKLSKDNHGFFPVQKNIQYFSLRVLGVLYVRQKLLSFNFSTVLESTSTSLNI